MSAIPVTTERLPVIQHATPSISFTDLERISKAISPQLFGLKNNGEVFTLMMLGQADGIHPVTALRRYHIVNGKPSMKADAMLACFLEAGGKVEWIARTDRVVKATFTVKTEKATIEWTMERANAAKITGKDVWKQYPCQMLTARVISEGIRLVMPQIVTGIYTPEEVSDFNAQPPADAVPPAQQTVEDRVHQSSTEAWGNAQPPVDAIPPAEVAERIKNLNAWVMDILNCDTFQRTPETMALDTYKTQIDKDSVGLPADEVRKLKMLAFTQYLTCMITTAPAEELNGKSYVSDKTWDAQIEDYKLPEADKAMLRECLRMNREAMAKAA